MRLQAKKALVTAAGAGIGRAIALAFAREGAQVMAVDIDEMALAQLGSGTPSIRTAVLDVTNPQQIADVQADNPHFDIIVNAAGFVHAGSILDCDEGDWARSLELNMTSIYRIIRAWLPNMVATGGGSIVNIASVASSIRGVPNRFVYGATKAGVIGLTKAVAADFVDKGVRCNAICPGWVDTPINHAHAKMLGGLDHVYKTIDSFQPIGRPGTSREIANVVLFLASDESSFMTGSIVSADGGMTAQ